MSKNQAKCVWCWDLLSAHAVAGPISATDWHSSPWAWTTGHGRTNPMSPGVRVVLSSQGNVLQISICFYFLEPMMAEGSGKLLRCSGVIYLTVLPQGTSFIQSTTDNMTHVAEVEECPLRVWHRHPYFPGRPTSYNSYYCLTRNCPQPQGTGSSKGTAPLREAALINDCLTGGVKGPHLISGQR